MLTTLTLAAANPVDHVANHVAPGMRVDLFGIENLWLWSGHTGNLVLSGLILCLVGPWVASRVATGPESQGADRYVTKNRFAHMIEVICLYLREQTVRPLLGDRTDRFMPFIWTMFFFILVNNLLGLVPLLDLQHALSKDMKNGALAWFGGTATQSIFVTAILAVLSFLVVNVAGVRELGVGGYAKHLTGGAPPAMWPILVPVEILGTFVKPFALAVRLFANMTAGHILMATLFMFAGMGAVLLNSGGLNILLGGGITVVSAVAAVAVYFLELFVAFLQAFVFVFLTTVFISQLSHHHDHEHDEGHSHEHAHA